MSQQPQSLTNLARPRQEVKTKLSERIAIGEQLLLTLNIDSFEASQVLADKYSRRSEYNGELLLRLFTNARIAKEYGGRSLYGTSVENVSLNEAVFQIYRYLEEETQRLRSILQRTELMSKETALVDEIGSAMPLDMEERNASTQDPRVVFIVHGRNSAARNAMFQFLRSIGLRPREWSQAVEDTGKASPYIGEVLDVAFSKAQAVVVLMTPDDEARLRAPYRSAHDGAHETELTPQARPNVIFEAGMAMGRSPDRTVIVEVGNMRPFSDIAGRHVIRMDNSSERRQEVAQRLRKAGCDVDLTGTDWHREGDFNVEATDSIAVQPLLPQTQAAQEEAQSGNASDSKPRSLVLLLPPEGEALIIEALRIETGETISMSLLPAAGKEAAALDALQRDIRGKAMPVAYGMKAIYARISSLKHVVEGGQELWNVEWQPDESGSGMSSILSEHSLTQHSIDQIAEMRARRILLNEKLADYSNPYRGANDLSVMLLESSIAGQNSTIQVERSPFPALFKDANGHTGEFLATARLFAVLYLLLTNTVERIHRLELRMQSDAVLEVKFEGQRRKQYTNKPAHIIKVDGVCKLEDN